MKVGFAAGVAPPNRFVEVDVLLPNSGPLVEGEADAEAGGLAATDPPPNAKFDVDPDVVAEFCVPFVATVLDPAFPLVSSPDSDSGTRLLTCAFSVVKTTSKARVGMTRGLFAIFLLKYSFRPSANRDTNGPSWVGAEVF